MTPWPPPITPCEKGHITCTACRSKMKDCCSCKDFKSDIGSLICEQVMFYTSTPCQYKQYGCNIRFEDKDKDKGHALAMHEKECKFRVYNCPFHNCQIKSKNILDHLSNAHSTNKCTKLEGDELSLSMCVQNKGPWLPKIITCHNMTFFEVTLLEDKELYHWIWILGDKKDASDFRYQIKVEKYTTKLTYEGNVHSLYSTKEEILDKGKSVLPVIIVWFRNDDTVMYNLKIIKRGHEYLKTDL